MEKLLIVDDEPDIVEVLRTYLEFEGYEVWTASNGVEALEMAANLPDAILLDAMLPQMTGWDVCAELKRRPDTLSIPVIIISARTQGEDLERGREAGAEYYITKPFDLLALRDTLEQALEAPSAV
jgi:CheY-like chemotaxis protein